MSAGTRVSRLRAFRPVTLVVASPVLLSCIIAVQPTWAAPFSVSFRENLNFVCAPDNNVPKQPNLASLCTNIIGDGPNVGSAFSSIPTGGSPQGMLAIEQRLQSSREAEEEKIEGKSDGQSYALRNTFAQREGALQLPPAGGASPNVVYGVGSGTSVFFSAGAYAQNHHNNRFEDGYEAQLPTVTVGADYRINEWLLAGLALNYTNYDGTYDDGGGFDKHIFGPLLYATFLPFQGAFANVVLGYARQENENNRLATASSTADPSAHLPGAYLSRL